MSDITGTISFAGQGLRRGDYITISGTSLAQRQRVLRVNGPTLTVRPAHAWRAFEWARARAEDWFVWPLSDLKSFIRVRPE